MEVKEQAMELIKHCKDKKGKLSIDYKDEGNWSVGCVSRFGFVKKKISIGDKVVEIG